LKKDGNWVRGKRVGKYTLTFLRSYPTRTRQKPDDDLEDLARNFSGLTGRGGKPLPPRPRASS
jgi:hypothetical protein